MRLFRKVIVLLSGAITFIAAFWCGRILGAHTEYIIYTPENICPAYADFPVRGESDAPVVVTAYFDYECRYTLPLLHSLDSIISLYPADSIFYVRKPRPLYKKPYLREKIYAAYVAHERGIFDKMHEMLLTLPPAKKSNRYSIRESIESYAQKSVCEANGFLKEMGMKKMKKRANLCLSETHRYGITALPAVIVNGKIFMGAQAIEEIGTTINRECDFSISLR